MRLFLALVPPPELRARLGELADLAHARCGGRRVPDESLHLTLAFLGEVAPRKAEELVDWVSRLEIPAGRWRLDTWGSFRRPGILWIGSQRPDVALPRLHDSLWQALEARDLQGRPSRFIPHVTLLRRARRLTSAGLPDFDLEWSYNQLELIHSITDKKGARYTTLTRSNAA